MEILDPAAVAVEQTGLMRNGVRWFPKAKPRLMFRIFRARLKTLDRALNEIGRVKIVERYLAGAAEQYLAGMRKRVREQRRIRVVPRSWRVLDFVKRYPKSLR